MRMTSRYPNLSAPRFLQPYLCSHAKKTHEGLSWAACSPAHHLLPSEDHEVSSHMRSIVRRGRTERSKRLSTSCESKYAVLKRRPELRDPSPARSQHVRFSSRPARY